MMVSRHQGELEISSQILASLLDIKSLVNLGFTNKSKNGVQ